MGRARTIQRLLKALGAYGTYLGYGYLTEGILQVMSDPSCLNYITKGLYTGLAVKHHSDWRNIERDMRTVIIQIWERGDRELLDEIAGRHLEARPKNGEFIKMIAEYVSAMEEAAAAKEE